MSKWQEPLGNVNPVLRQLYRFVWVEAGKNVAEKLRAKVYSLTNENQKLALKLFLSWLFGDPRYGIAATMSERSSFYLIEHAAKAFIIKDGQGEPSMLEFATAGAYKMLESLEQAR